MSKRWYVVQAYSGFEKNVQKTLKERIARENMVRDPLGLPNKKLTGLVPVNFFVLKF